MKTKYRAVPDFPGYRVGSDGTIWSRWRNGGADRTGQVLTDAWHQLMGWVDKRRGQQTGYLKVGLMRDGKLHHRKVHQLVLEAFVGACPAGMQSRHLDDDKANNSVENLAWGTTNQNNMDRYDNKLMPTGEGHHRAKLKEDDIVEIRRLLASGMSERKVAARYGVSKGTIRAIKLGKTWNRGTNRKAVRA